MFDNIGGKIKRIAETGCWIGIIFSVIMGLFFMLDGISGALFYFVLCPIASWLVSVLIYGFGELVENSTESKEHLKYLADAERKRSAGENVEEEASAE